jgi:hypothetical protein
MCFCGAGTRGLEMKTKADKTPLRFPTSESKGGIKWADQRKLKSEQRKRSRLKRNQIKGVCFPATNKPTFILEQGMVVEEGCDVVGRRPVCASQ